MLITTIPTLNKNMMPRQIKAVEIPPSLRFKTSSTKCFCISGFKSVTTAARIINTMIPANFLLYGAAIFKKPFQNPPSLEQCGQYFVPGIAWWHFGHIFSYSVLTTSSSLPDARIWIPLAM